MTRGTLSRISLTAPVFLLCVNSARSDEIRRLTLSEPVHLAMEQNRTLKIARFKVKENEERKAGARSAYFPTITNQPNALYISELQNIVIPPGSLGTAAGASIPPQSIAGSQGKQTPLSSGTMIAQLPLIVRAYGPERNSLFAIGILPVQSGTPSSTPVSKHQRPEAFQRPWAIKTLGVNDEFSAKFR